MARKIGHKIVVAGWPGTGTTTAAQGVVDRLGEKWRAVRPASDTFRRMAVERYPNLEKGEALVKLELDACSDFSIDQACDTSLREFGKREEFFVADARLGAYFVPDALKVYLYCSDGNTRLRRVAEREKKSFTLAANETIAREQASTRRYFALYGIEDIARLDYDLVIDTCVVRTDEVIDKIVAKFYELAT